MGSSNGLHVPGFKKAGISSGALKELLLLTSQRALSTGVKVVDDVFGGILPGDMVLLGAKTGVGKTDFACKIAMHNATLGKQVHLYALEAEESEIEMRIIYQAVVRKARSINPRKKYNYKHWRLGRYVELGCYYDECIEELNNFENLHIYYRTKKFGLEEFVKETTAIKDASDLIIIDHIHYFDLTSDNENKEMSEIIRKIRDINLAIKVPVIVLGHLRKLSGANAKLVPEVDDFMGSSDLTKVCTKAVILAPAAYKNGESETYFSFPKTRGFGLPGQFLFKSNYNVFNNRYSDIYTVARFTSNGKSFDFLKHMVDPQELTWLG